MSTVFAAVSDDTRRGLLEQLRRQGPLSITDMASAFPITRQAVTKHLRILIDAGLVATEWRGRERLHRLRARPLKEVDEWLRPYAAAWDRRLNRLKVHLGEETS